MEKAAVEAAEEEAAKKAKAAVRQAAQEAASKAEYEASAAKEAPVLGEITAAAKAQG